MEEIFSNSEKDTLAWSKKFAQTLNQGALICLSGELGAGKTIFTKGLALGLGVGKTVNSPTFVIMKLYPATHNSISRLVHIDAYRLNSGQDLANIGALEYINDPQTLTVIEWPEKVNEILPPNRIDIRIEDESNNKRKITLAMPK